MVLERADQTGQVPRRHYSLDSFDFKAIASLNKMLVTGVETRCEDTSSVAENITRALATQDTGKTSYRSTIRSR